MSYTVYLEELDGDIQDNLSSDLSESEAAALVARHIIKNLSKIMEIARNFSDKEYAIFKLRAEGKSFDDIALELELHRTTVTRIYTKITEKLHTIAL